jgi:hypothetical protein
MATRQERLSSFIVRETPANDRLVEVLCEDNSGTYLLPFPCNWSDGAWLNSVSGSKIEARVVGWRPWRIASRD